jgi:quercetin dioxygenase-like cupin family protein
MTIEFVRPEETRFVRLDEMLAQDPQRLERYGEERLTEVRSYVKGAPEQPQLFEVRQPPNSVTQAHAHSEDEIIYVLEGDIVFGNRSFPAGTAIYVPANTLYGFHAGEQGLRFLNFGPRSDTAYLFKDEFLAQRGAVRASADAAG